MNPNRQLSLVARGTAIFAAVRQFGKALVGQPSTGTISRPTIGDFTPMLWGGRRMTPDQVRFVLEAAIGGNIQQQWALFDMMEDTWPRLTKNLAEVRRAAARATYSVQPYAERGEKPTDTAKERADVIEATLRNWRPRPGTLELGLEDGLFNALDALGKGLSVMEVTWQRADEGLLPRCAHLLHPSKYGWNNEGNELGLINAGVAGSQSAWQAFPDGQFWIGVWHARSGAPGQTALLRSLAPYWCGITFGWEWLLNNAQIFGVPFRWATYDPNRPENLTTISQMLANMGAAGWAAFPEGTTLDFKEAVTRATDNPQVFIQTLADKYCDQLILGQEASSESKPAGIGNGASNLHGDVRSDRLQDAAQWCADLLNYQLVPAALRLNFGDEAEPPTIVPDIAGETDPKAKADRDLILSQMGLPLPVKYLYERHAIPEPEEGDETIGGIPDGANDLPPQGGPSSGSAPGGGGLPESDPAKSTQEAENAMPGVKTATPGVEARKINPPRSAVALNATKSRGGSVHKPVLPGAYQTPDATRRALAEAHARDFAPLRKAAEPLLAAIQAGNLDVVGELEAFIAKLDALAPGMVGASELADSLEAALAEAAIAGAVQSYGKISTTTKTNQ